jgi:hypothetical protein
MDDLFDLILELSKVLEERGDEERAYSVMTALSFIMDEQQDTAKARKIALKELYSC